MFLLKALYQPFRKLIYTSKDISFNKFLFSYSLKKKREKKWLESQAPFCVIGVREQGLPRSNLFYMWDVKDHEPIPGLWKR